jgi:hypothetical protein
MRRRILQAVAGVGIAVCIGRAASQEAPATTPGFPRGRELAQKYCANCHSFPEPALLTKSAWVHHIQPEMAKWLGLERVDYEGLADGKLLLEANLFPPSPIISEDDWFAIWDYYRATAPSRAPPQVAKPTPPGSLKQFRVRKLNPHSGVPMSSLVKIDAERRRLYLGDAFASGLFVLNPAGEALERVKLASPPVSLVIHDSAAYATLVGRFFPSDALEGSVVRLPRDVASAPPRALLEQLRRPTDAVVTRLNTDSRDDLVVCSFGNRLGRLSWFEGRESGGFEEHILLERPGALRAEVRDFNADGRPDILVLTAQAREGLFLFLNQGRNEFTMETLLEFPPVWGLASFDLVDFNKDGKLDLLVANGDNGDFALPLKNYHGVRLYLNDGGNRFTGVFFYPLHGAYKAVARDFDADGDFDLAAIAFYPDFEQARPESLVYLENLGGMQFAAATCGEGDAGRWMVMDAGDLDGDGDEDLAVGSFVRGPTTVPVPPAMRDYWRTNGAAVLLLENLLRGTGN